MTNPTTPDPSVDGLIQYLASDTHAHVDDVAVTPFGTFEIRDDALRLCEFKGWPRAGTAQFVRIV